MNPTRGLLLLAVVLAVASSLLWVARPKPSPATLVQGQTVRAWVKEVEIGGFPETKKSALDLLIAAGSRILPDLCAILEEPESMSDATLRLPVNPLTREQKLRQEADSEVLPLKARAAYVMSTIAYRNPGSNEAKACVPFLLKGLNSGGSNVRIYCVQTLGVIGPEAHTAIPAIIVRTKDENSSVRMSAVEALGRIGIATPECLTALTNALSDTSSDVTITATNTLKKLTAKQR